MYYTVYFHLNSFDKTFFLIFASLSFLIVDTTFTSPLLLFKVLFFFIGFSTESVTVERSGVEVREFLTPT